MKVALTGATGLVGGGVLRALVAGGHEVVALVRSEQSAAIAGGNGATPTVGDLGDGDWLRETFASVDGVIHTASPGDADSPEFDRTIAHAAVDALAAGGKPYLHTSGCWIFGSGSHLTETSPLSAPDLTAWRPDVEAVVTGDSGIRGVVVGPAIVYAPGQGLTTLLTTPAADGSFHTIGDGSQHWATVGADELGDLYARAITDDNAQGYYLGANDGTPTVGELVAAAADGGRVVTETPDESRERLNPMLVDALLLDQVIDSAKARDELGWQPADRPLLELVSAGAFR